MKISEGIHLKNAFKTLIAALAVLALASAPVLAVSSPDTAPGGAYTTEQMLVRAMEDECAALEGYQAIIAQFGAFRPFTRLIAAEQRHIDLLTPLFDAYGVTGPDRGAADTATAPATLEEAYEAGRAAETASIEMYDAFLAQSLPADVRAVFTVLKAASETPLASLARARSGRAGNNPAGRSGRGADGGRGRGNAGANRRN
jgi:rubrerythrin